LEPSLGLTATLFEWPLSASKTGLGKALIAHPSLQQALNELLKDQDDISSDPILAEDRLEIRLEYMEEPDPLEDIDAESDSTDTVDLEGLDEDSSDAESFVSNDSITRNADFIPLWD
jgi:hypothetical protein